MRQGGMKPKSHSSGVYWVRATGNTKGKKEAPSKEEFDWNNDGIIDDRDWRIKCYCFLAGILICCFVLSLPFIWPIEYLQ